ncbi:helix-turn-helix domain-containing protein [Paenibacillus xylaniclasticus]|uniref:helix-turn-helix domain-containing protein n=1 Tax=Paenibacillus xylaniclasticus TaxID=588083 RepID=UPI000FDAE1DC|nr:MULTISPECIES: RodZ domain-containing protein [Paenibacillus]GFN31826.1 XRE family transcriptional regulator [Paenibacillus curdlanolyticus]
MSELGELLKKAREQRGLSLDDIQEATKIRKRYLEAIESGDYKVLPGTFYVRAFVKTYAEEVGLDPDDVLRLYKHEIPEAAPESVVEPIVRQPRKASQTSSDRWSKFGFTGIMLSFIVVIAAVVWIYAIKNNDGDDVSKADDQTKITDSTELPKEPEQQPSAPDTTTPDNNTPTNDQVIDTTPPQQTTVTLSHKSGRVDHYDVGPAGAHTLKISIKGGTNWLEVRENSNQGNKLFYKNATDGTEQTYTLDKPLYVNVGRADLVEITIDGVLVEDGNRTSTKKMQFNPVTAEAGTTGNASGTEGGNTGTVNSNEGLSTN